MLRALLPSVTAIMLGCWVVIAAAQPQGPASLTDHTVLAAAGCDASYPDFCIPPPPPDLNCGSAAIAGRHNFRVLPPDPHHFDTDHDGIGCEAAFTDTPTPTSVAVATATFTATPGGGGLPTATATVGVPVVCSPRPPVRVTVARGAAGQLHATLSATSNASGGTNTIAALAFGTIRNATVQVVGAGAAQSGHVVPVAAGTQMVALVVTRTVSGQTVLVPLTVTDACGDWRTFVGGGPGAF
jgi:hypothetical protein